MRNEGRVERGNEAINCVPKGGGKRTFSFIQGHYLEKLFVHKDLVSDVGLVHV